MSLKTRPLHSAWIIAGILLVATNLRAPFTAASPLLDAIRDAFGMGATQAGVLITFPLLTFCAVSPFAAPLARKLGLERALFLALAVMAAGILVRSAGPAWALFLGTGVLGAGIAIGNTLLPSLLKRDFPDRITGLTAIYSITMGVASAVGSAVVVPLMHAFDWRIALGAFLVLPVASALVWAPQLRGSPPPAAGAAAPRHGGAVWRSALAWQVTLFFGVNSFVYYAIGAWLPSILASIGYSQAEAGSFHGVMQLATALPGFVIAPLVRRASDQRSLAAALALTSLASLAGLQFFPALALLWVAVFGFGIGGAFILALAFIGLRTASAPQTASLSGMTQSVGYLMSATGPVLAGALHDLVDSWPIVLLTCAVLCLVLAFLGLGAGRALHIDADARDA